MAAEQLKQATEYLGQAQSKIVLLRDALQALQPGETADDIEPRFAEAEKIAAELAELISRVRACAAQTSRFEQFRPLIETYEISVSTAQQLIKQIRARLELLLKQPN